MVEEALEIARDGQYILVPNSDSLRFTNAMTIEGWIRPMDIYTDQHIVSTAGGTGPSPSGHDYFLNIVDRKMGFGINGSPLLTSAVITNAGQWYHVAATYSSADRIRRLYLDGVLVRQAPYTFPINTGHTAVTIGVNARNAAYADGFASFKGQLDEITLYSRALSADEIKAIYDAGSSGKCRLPAAPTIVTQPANREVIVGAIEADFVVGA
jgi:hypothetical protein